MSDKQLTTKQQSFLDHLTATGGDPKKAAELAGYSTHWHVVKALKPQIIDLASNILAQSAPKAAQKLVDVMESNEPIPQASMRVQAAVKRHLAINHTQKVQRNSKKFQKNSKHLTRYRHYLPVNQYLCVMGRTGFPIKQDEQ